MAEAPSLTAAGAVAFIPLQSAGVDIPADPAVEAVMPEAEVAEAVTANRLFLDYVFLTRNSRFGGGEAGF
jgi:hypothetical protein